MEYAFVPVRYGMMGFIDLFLSEPDPPPHIGALVILKTARGIEHGVVHAKARDIPMPEYPPEQEAPRLLRIASDVDLGIIEHISTNREPDEQTSCQEFIAQRQLPMKLVGVEHLFGNDKVVFYFMADGRIDFRELVKDLARKYRMRIEMRQIGVRDEARLLADFEHCGRELCCRTFLNRLDPVTMRMAKTQKTTLDPSKISGHCGRLMCCLRFEDDVYSTAQADLPEIGSTHEYEDKTVTIIAVNPVSREVTIKYPDNSEETMSIVVLTGQGFAHGEEEEYNERCSRNGRRPFCKNYPNNSCPCNTKEASDTTSNETTNSQ